MRQIKLKQQKPRPFKVTITALFLGLTLQANALSIGGIFGASPSYDKNDPGSFIEQLASKKKFPKEAYTPPEKLLAPFATAQLDKPVALAIKDNIALANAPVAQAYCQKIVDRLLAEWDGSKPESVKVYIRETPHYGAVAYDSGVIMVNAGTFRDIDAKAEEGQFGAEYEEELALMLSHELGHILLHHFKRNKYMKKIIKGIKHAASASITYATLQDSSYNAGKFKAKGDQKAVLRNFKKGLALNVFAADIANPIWKSGQEENADIIGIDLAKKAGYPIDDSVIVKFVGKHSDQQERMSRENEALRTLMKAEVVAASKQIVIEQTAGRNPAGLDFGPASELLNQAKGAVTEKAVDAVFLAIAKINKDHPSKEERLDTLRGYMMKNYRKKGKRIRHDNKSFKKVSGNPNMVRLIAKLDTMHKFPEMLFLNPYDETPKQLIDKLNAATRAQQTKSARETKKPSKAVLSAKQIKKYQNQKSFVTLDAPLTLFVNGVLHDRSKHPKQSLKSLQKGAQSDYATVNHIQLLGHHYFHEKYKKSLSKLISRTDKLIGTSEPIIDLIVADAKLNKNIAKAEINAAKCLEYEKGRLYPYCVAYLGYDPTMKDVEAQTPEGKKAFEGKSFIKMLKSGLNIFD